MNADEIKAAVIEALAGCRLPDDVERALSDLVERAVAAERARLMATDTVEACERMAAERARGIANEETAWEAKRSLEAVAYMECPRGCGCVTAEDPDRKDCGCAGPCCMSDDWPLSYRDALAAERARTQAVIDAAQRLVEAGEKEGIEAFADYLLAVTTATIELRAALAGDPLPTPQPAPERRRCAWLVAGDEMVGGPIGGTCPQSVAARCDGCNGDGTFTLGAGEPQPASARCHSQCWGDSCPNAACSCPCHVGAGEPEP